MGQPKITPITTAFSDGTIRTMMNHLELRVPVTLPVMHCHAFFELFVVLSGSLRLEFLHQEDLVLQAGDVGVVPPEVYHDIKNDAVPTQVAALRFMYTLDSSATAGVIAFCDGALHRLDHPMVLPACCEVCDLLQRIREEQETADFGGDDLVETLLKQFYITLFRRMRDFRPQTADAVADCSEDSVLERSDRIETFFGRHYVEEVTEETLAEAMGLSKRQLSRVLRTLYGKTFREILVQTRLHHALQMLGETEESVERIAGAVGYTSLSGFYAAFQKQFRMSPRQYRKKLKETADFSDSGT